jgi:hypothetical protein
MESKAEDAEHYRHSQKMLESGRFNNRRRQKRKQDLTRTSEKVCERAQIEQEKQDHIRKNKMKQKLQSEN